MTNRSKHTSLWLHFATLLIYYWGVEIALADHVNVTIDDTDPMILYAPLGSWRSSSVACSGCLNPGTKNAFQSTYHEGTHLDMSPDDHGDDDGNGSNNMEKWQEERRSTVVHHRRKDNPDDTGTEVLVSAHFNFTGSAVYLYCIQPLGIPLDNATPTSMNLSFTLDNILVGNFSHQGSKPASGYAPHVNVFAQTNLTDTFHAFRVDVGVSSVFLFDYMIYTRDNRNDTTPNVPSRSVDERTRKHNIATFAGAVGGSVGVLAVISLCLALSIIKRRRNYNRRERCARGRSSLHTNASDDSPAMIGPALFVPRFFPGTQIPSISPDPPPYIESISNPSSLSPSSPEPSSPPMLSSTTPIPYSAHVRDTDFANIPPTSPLPVDIAFPSLDDTILTPPPPFDEAIAAVLPAESPPSAAISAQQSPDVNVTPSGAASPSLPPSPSLRPPS